MRTKANKVFFSLLGLIALTSANGIAFAGDLSDEESAAINRQLEQAKTQQAALAALQAALAASQEALATSQEALAASRTALAASQTALAAASQAALAASHKPAAATDKPAAAMNKPAAAIDKPAAAINNKPAVAINKPAAAIEEKPAIAITKPAAIEDKPAIAITKPAAAATNKPAAATNKPAAAIEEKPAIAITKPAAATNKPATPRALISDEEDRHLEQTKAQKSALVATNPSATLHALHAESCHLFTDAERKTIDKGEVVLGMLEKNGHKRIRARVHISAPPHVVWETVHEERKTDPDLAYSKVLETSGHNSVLEQKFQLIPVLGTSVCVMKNSEVPGHRIDYSLMKSDRFKALEGTWIVSANPDGSTILELSSYIDMGLPVPRSMLEAVASKKLAGRLQNIRKMAEQARPTHSVAAKVAPH